MTTDSKRTTFLEKVRWRQKSKAVWLRDGASALSSSIERPIRIGGITTLNSWWLMVQSPHISLRSEIKLYNSTIDCLPNSTVDSLSWMALLLIPLGRKGHLVERAFEEDKVIEVVKALNSAVMVLLWHSSKLVGMFLK